MTDEQSTATEKLDAILNYLNDNRKLAFHYGYGLPRTYKKPKKINLTDQDILNVLDKLTRDNMVRVTTMGIGNGNSNSAKHYTISIDGEVLLQDNGYTKKLNDERLNQEKNKHDLKFSKTKDTILTVFSVVAGISTLGLLIVEVYNIFCS